MVERSASEGRLPRSVGPLEPVEVRALEIAAHREVDVVEGWPLVEACALAVACPTSRDVIREDVKRVVRPVDKVGGATRPVGEANVYVGGGPAHEGRGRRARSTTGSGGRGGSLRVVGAAPNEDAAEENAEGGWEREFANSTKHRLPLCEGRASFVR